MFRELLSFFRGDSPLKAISEDFTNMLHVAREMVLEASKIFWEEDGDQPERREALYHRDLEVNKLERRIRKKIVAHLAVQAPHDVPYSLLMMSLVKDVERIGDYAKNMVDVADLVSETVPDHPLVQELLEIRASVETLISDAAQVFLTSDQTRATELTEEGRSVAKRCDQLVVDVAASDFPAAKAVKISMGGRFYKRIEGHLLNIISSVIMPLHKLDYYDEDLLPTMQEEYERD